MSTILLNLDFGGSPPKKALEGNAKHRKFVKKHRLLEQKGFLDKKKQTPSKVTKLHSEPPKKGENVRVDGTWKIPPLSRKKTPAPSTGSGLSLDKKTAVPWLTPAPSKKVNSVVAKVDILPPCHIVDYRTTWSRICKKHMVNATPFKIARSQILKIILGKIVVGHAIHNDFKALQYFHPKSLTRDTSQIPLLNRKANCPENAIMSLKCLTKQLLHRNVQIRKGGHSSVEDAQATMELYKFVEVEWEQHLAQNPPKN